ncbi:E3 ubiquitin-protein ligase ATL31-like [Zingiber officinale]|uniref:RING-type E3 ubiquitin transferase n=1 Tax=Zingiber officinale TaxID=94328 RepID=A0A8J5CD51_ZINOF|nr:E3 ubiquitin-protein ligase ATL31-like [Zingiber officinale]KAG6471564.1 hypothetical protein ZIOFF_069008 [Zingiber officinale]
MASSAAFDIWRCYKLITVTCFSDTISPSMATKMVAFLLLLLLHLRCSVAQVSTENRNGNYNYYGRRFNPTLAVVIVVIASTFFFLAAFAIFLRRCSGEDDFAGAFFRGSVRRDGGGSASRRRGQGLSQEALDKLPRMRFTEAKGLKGVAPECAVCLSEFEDDEELVRLRPGCGHVFHADCITAWLASHVSCPVCRANLAELAAEATTAGEPQAHTAIVVDEAEEAVELARLGRQRREARSTSGRRPTTWFPRSHSTGHSATVRPTAVEEGADVERVVVAERNQWPSVFLRSLSARLPEWAGRRRGDEEGVNSRGGRSAAATDAGSSSTSFPPSQV